MKSSVKIVDTLSYSTFHEVFNSSIIYICSLIFNKVKLRSSFSARETTEKLIYKYNQLFNFKAIEYNPVYVIDRDDKIGGLFKYILSGWLNFWIYITTPKNICILYTNNNPLSLIWVTTFNHILRKDVVIFCHGELELLLQNPPIYKPSFWYKYIFKFMFKYGLIGKHVKMFVLGDSILRNLTRYLNKYNQKQFYSIEHPYFFSNKPRKIKDFSNSIGTVGVMTYKKGLKTLLELSREVKISVIGRVMANINYLDYPNINFVVKDQKFIHREQYENAISKLDYILFLYPSYSYKLIASGAIFDAIDMNVPIIAISNDYFKNTLSKLKEQ